MNGATQGESSMSHFLNADPTGPINLWNQIQHNLYSLKVIQWPNLTRPISSLTFPTLNTEICGPKIAVLQNYTQPDDL